MIPFLFIQPIAHSPNSLKYLGIFAVILDFFTNPVDMYHNCGAVPRIFISPDFFKKLLSGKHNVWIQCQKLQQFKLPVGKFNFSVTLINFLAIDKNPKISDPDFRRRLFFTLFYLLQHSVMLTDIGIDSGHQFRRIKRFCNIIVCAYAQSPHLVHRLCAGRHH